MDWICYLKDAQLVANFQHFFGIESLTFDDKKDQHLNGHSVDCQNDETTNHHSRQRNRHDEHHNLSTSSSFENKKYNSKSYDLIRTPSSEHVKALSKKNYVIKNLAFYYVFCFGSSLGYEIFYALFFPFFLHNIDSFVGRRLIVIWSVSMYIGQALKDIIKWNRPRSPPVVVLEPEYSMEYGMPSTHAIVGFALPFSIFIFTQSRYDYPFWMGFALASIWCLLVCGSRLYLGMHTVLDILVGVLLSASILAVCVHVIDQVDELHLQSSAAPLVSFTIVCLMSFFYPKSDRWSPARGDTCVMVGFGYGTLLGAWINYRLNILDDYNYDSLIPLKWPGCFNLFIMLLRTIINALTIESTRIFGKKIIYPSLCQLQNLDSKDSQSMKVASVEVPLKLITYTLIGINVATLLPIAFDHINLHLE